MKLDFIFLKKMSTMIIVFFFFHVHLCMEERINHTKLSTI
jgi:hypothetical protein